MEKQRSVEVRKGAWTKDEDLLLTKCIHKFGEGRWHLVPLRAGLNRCRKSCRLRWLNYLSPNVKRGLFSMDEVDLIVRLHKLLGNRWSLIAGRIPGRTANDIKNFWNTNIHKKSSATNGESRRATMTQSSTIRPQPRNFSSPLKQTTSEIEVNDKNNETPMNMQPLDDYQLAPEGEEVEEECIGWWANLLKTCENENGARVPFSFPEDDAQQPMMLFPGLRDQMNNHAAISGGGLSGFELDVDVWELVSMNNQ